MSRQRLPLLFVALVVGGGVLFLILRGGGRRSEEGNRETLLPIKDRATRPSERPALSNLDPDLASPALSSLALPPPTEPEDAVVAQLRFLEPASGDWDTETASEAIGLQLKRIKAWIEAGGVDESIQAVAGAGFRAIGPPAVDLRPVVDEAVFRVLRPSGGPGTDLLERGLPGALRTFTGAGSKPRFEAKITGIDAIENGWRTRVLVEFRHESGGRLEQRNATWQCDWSGTLLLRIDCLDYEEVSLPGTNPLFADATAATMRTIPSYPGQVLRGIAHDNTGAFLASPPESPFFAFSGTWEKATIVLPPAVITNGEVIVEWQFYSRNDGLPNFAGWYIDDVTVRN